MKSFSKISFDSMADLKPSNKKLGKGSYAKVKLLKHVLTGTFVALKVIDLRQSGSFDEDYAQIDAECRVHAALDHPNIIK